MNSIATGQLVKGVGGLYYVKVDKDVPDIGGEVLPCRARGKFRHEGVTPLVGDNVEILYNDGSLPDIPGKRENSGTAEIVIDNILPRKNALIRPPLANLDTLFIAMASASPMPLLDVVDKLISIAEFNHIEPVIVVGKNDLDRDNADNILALYRKAGFTCFGVSALKEDGLDELRAYIHSNMGGRMAAFAGASGVGKSSLLNALFPSLHLQTGDVSRKTERGKNTTRHVELFEIPTCGQVGYLADTPGFSMLDFVHFDFFEKEDLPGSMRDFLPYLGSCRYKKCTHTKEEGCAILEAVKNGEIAQSRHESFLSMYLAVKDKHDWTRQKGASQ